MSSFESVLSRHSNDDPGAHYENNNHIRDGLRRRRSDKNLSVGAAVTNDAGVDANHCDADVALKRNETWQRGGNAPIPTVTEKLEKDCEMIMQVKR